MISTTKGAKVTKQLFEKPSVEGLRQQLADAMPSRLTFQVSKNDLQIARELPQDLAACATWRRRCIGWRDDHHTAELAMTFGQRFENGDAFGAHREAIRRVFEVAAGDDGAVGGFDGCANLEMGEISARVLASVAGGFDQGMRVECRVPNPGS